MRINKILIHCCNESIGELVKRTLDRPENILITSTSLVETIHNLSKGGVDVLIIECSGNEDEVIRILDEAAGRMSTPATIVIGAKVSKEAAIEIVEHGCTYIIENMMELRSLDKLLISIFEEESRSRSREQSRNDTRKIISNLENDIELKLSRRELEILHHLIQGKQNKAISRELGISEKTVKNHLWKIYRKFGVENRTELFNILIQSCGCMQLVSSDSE